MKTAVPPAAAVNRFGYLCSIETLSGAVSSHDLMLRIIGIQRDEDPAREFVLLQNQGVLRVPLRGHVVADEASLVGDRERLFSFSDEEQIPAGCYALLVTGSGINGWRRSADGSHIYHVYWNKPESVWAKDSGIVHLLNVIHTNRPRAEGLLISR